MPEPIELHDVTSTNLAKLGYDGTTRTLAVEFRNGTIVHYFGIDPDAVQKLFGAESKGAYYAKEIRGKYQGQRMTGPCEKCGANGWIGDTCVDCGCGAYQSDRATTGYPLGNG